MLLVGLSAIAFSDLALSVGVDERLSPDLLHHWWGAPFALLSGMGGLIALVGLAVVVRTGTRLAAGE